MAQHDPGGGANDFAGISVTPDVINPGKRGTNWTFLGVIFEGNEPRPDDRIMKNDRIKKGDIFENPIPHGNAEKGHLNGAFAWNIHRPGIPGRKFTLEQNPNTVDRMAARRAGNGQQHPTWPIQSVYKDPATKAVFATYVGWEQSSTVYEEFKKLDGAAMATDEVREKFLVAIRDQAGVEGRDVARQYLTNVQEFMDNARHVFWFYEDMSYFHSRIQLAYGLGAVYYMNFRPDMTVPPNFHYSTFNVINSRTYVNYVQSSDFNQDVEVIAQVKDNADDTTNQPKRRRGERGPGCMTPKRCLCNRVFAALFAEPGKVNMIPNTKKMLDFGNLQPTDQIVLVECSDSCGCNLFLCPRRRLQQGQMKSLVVFYENDSYGLRSAAEFKEGEFICELIGEVKPLDPDEENGEYRTGFKSLDNELVIDSSKIGNIARFIKTSPNPNAILVETYSREQGNFPLIPRISVYARQAIHIGECITKPNSCAKPSSPQCDYSQPGPSRATNQPSTSGSVFDQPNGVGSADRSSIRQNNDEHGNGSEEEAADEVQDAQQ